MKHNLSSLNNVSTTAIREDIQKLNTDGLESFDMVMMLHMLYYVQLEHTLKTVTKLVKSNGKQNIVCINGSTFCTGLMLIAIDGDGVLEIMDHFWSHESHTKFNFAPSVISVLDSMKYKYTVTSSKYTLDISQCIKDNFQLPHQRQLLDFLCQTKLKQYPTEVLEECIAYFVAIVDDKQRFTVMHYLFFITLI